MVTTKEMLDFQKCFFDGIEIRGVWQKEFNVNTWYMYPIMIIIVGMRGNDK
jgi:hypothetical protein